MMFPNSDDAVRVLIAPDTFKGSLSASQVGDAIAQGMLQACPSLTVEVVPVADGGEGTLLAALAAGYHRLEVPARGPTGRPGRSAIAVRGGSAVVELAQAAGLTRLPGGRLDPLGATSAGVGDLLQAALDHGCHEVILAVGGSASTDGGAGLLHALGARFRDEHGALLPQGERAICGADLASITAVDLSGLDPRWRSTRVTLASDVDNPLLGPAGAASVYGPQKGADPAQIVALERHLARWAELIDPAGADRPGAGAAGGVGFAAMSVLGAQRRPGIDVVLELTGLEQRLPGVTVVVTGEGRIDAQTLHGKAPAGVARAARSHSIPVIAVCGVLELSSDALRDNGIVRSYALTDLEPDVARCLAAPAPILRQIGARIIADHLDAEGSWRAGSAGQV